MQNIHIIVTGATGAIGKAICFGLLENPFIRVWALGRSFSKGELLLKEASEKKFESRIVFQSLDLSCKKEIRNFAEKFSEPVDVIINNAAQSPKTRTQTADKIETQWATNVLGYYWMTEFFSSKFRSPNCGRIINVASYWAGDLDLKDVEFKKRKYDNNSAYRQAKQADRMLTVALAEKYQGKISINSCHPGDVASKLSFDLGYGGSQTAEQGARTPIWLATGEEGLSHSGKYFANCRQAACEFSGDKKSIQSLFELIQRY